MAKKNGGTKKGSEKRLSRLQVMLSSDELTALDNFRFDKRMPSRASAIREILRRGLAAGGFASAATGSHSKTFGVLRDGSHDE
jgi:metal-responsive CopG/Arc/MetJ family transcriptional regulator